MMGSGPDTPSVGDMYDQLTDLLAQALGGNIHLGYWSGDSDESPVETATDALTDLVASRLEPSAGTRLLDVGCGSGKPASRIAALRGAHVTGITVSAHQCALARARPHSGAGSGSTTFQLADAMDMPLPDASFDGAYAIESVLHMSDKASVFRQLGRVLRPGARLVVADIYRDDSAGSTNAVPIEGMRELFQVSLATPGDYHRYLEDAGLRLVEFTDIRDHVRRGYTATVDFFRATAAQLDGEPAVQLAKGADVIEQFAALPQIGYVLLTAERP
ncbi:methyltransferase domain-containing protein [Streptomyces sp. NBC_01298]|uniref:SAM-dependent methyltransferase n=1 Tax=Streptomyces sp. NBC_01298 TaxID=2903817 RepID=UPI002E1535AF|nr:methyltransferase domain-containing protein [Streptomyces sp. NBC_01298]